ncbi:MAG: hypothetical protein NUV65_00630 [Candidatus Roizmanbacteria bacterium]|nr:hypothetical protein [Candidatus Roizmanbacteria bacterium]
MSKKNVVKQADIEKAVMAQVRSNKVTMKPRWYFIVGSLFMMIGLIALSIGAVFLTNLTLFLLREHGPMGQLRLQFLLDTFSWWIPTLAVVGIVFGVWILKKYDFSYKKNFLLITVGFVLSIIVAAFVIDSIGLNEMWARQGMMRRFYQRIENQNVPATRGQGRMQNGQGNRMIEPSK